MGTPTDSSYALIATLVSLLVGAVHLASLDATRDLIWAVLTSPSARRSWVPQSGAVPPP